MSNSDSAFQVVPLNSIFPFLSVPKSAIYTPSLPVNSSSIESDSLFLFRKIFFLIIRLSPINDRTETRAKIMIWRLVPGSQIRHTKAVTHAPRPKKKIKNPGVTSSAIKNSRPNMNQKSSGLERMFVIIIIGLINSIIR